MKKYGDNWTRVEGCPKTDNSWLCVSVGFDQIWVDEFEGKVFLREGKFSPIWYEKDI